jgi:hypothetical protein
MPGPFVGFRKCAFPFLYQTGCLVGVFSPWVKKRELSGFSGIDTGNKEKSPYRAYVFLIGDTLTFRFVPSCENKGY